MGRLVRIGTVAALVLVLGGPQPAEAAPRPESALPLVTQVDVSESISCARLSNGTARCWGFEEDGSLGNGPAGSVQGHPVTVLSTSGSGPLTGVTQVAVGFRNACAVLTSRQVRCWGDALGLGAGGAATDSDLPVVVRNVADTGPLTGVTQISANQATFCARLASGQARCWGLGPVGDGTLDDGVLPRVVVDAAGPLTGVTQVSAGNGHSCAVLTSRQVRCWGFNDDGQLGDDTFDQRLVATPVKGVDGDGVLSGVTQVDAGEDATCARVTSGRAFCWGANDDGRLGDGTEADSSVPTAVQSPTGDDDLRGVATIGVGANGTCARLAAGQVRCWGHEVLGNGDSSDTPTSLPIVVRNKIDTAPLANVADLAVDQVACAVLVNGQVRCWGNGFTGTLGNGSSSQVFLPVIVLRN
jgi:alpha-tubulin suppressor-like RCC1 family protein